VSINYKEISFEEAIEYSLINEGGYIKGCPNDFDRIVAIDKGKMFEFIRKSQPKEWQKLCVIHGGEVENKFIARLTKEIDNNGVLFVLRRGIVDLGVYIKLAYFKPSSGLNESLLEIYESNILSVTRQLKYSIRNQNSLDLVLMLNGIPLVTMELKNQFTGQTVANSIKQYKYDRDPLELIFQTNKRTVIHFAVDTDDVYMSTQLQGEKTVFLPFNKGDDDGSGNPPVEKGYKTSYLWEEVLCKDSILDIISRFLHFQKKEPIENVKTTREILIFPRYHQLDVVRKLEFDVKNSAEKKNYLIQHSAGSGKSNSIAWLTHRLANIHYYDDKPIFSSVIVVTDRKILDKQLQNTIYQFDHRDGLIEKIDKNSTQLAEALNKGRKIIITTIQKFPFLLNKVNNLSGRRFAVVIDEAHSSQSGETARKLKEVLSENNSFENDSDNEFDFQDEIIRELSTHGHQKNISYFAFTATPKNKTLELFGIKDENGNPKPFHLYSMKQAIEEGFILDVLKYYTTYSTYFKLTKGIGDDPKYSKGKAKRAINRFITNHPRNISQKIEIVIEHMQKNTINKICGKAKAMLITSSRIQAVKYYLECKNYLLKNNIGSIGVIVAFSGVVTDEYKQYTEASLNGFSEGELPSKFSSSKYNLLIVADKYQTGFDQPLLHTMFIDKKLSGVKAVQTLSRLNRTCKNKMDTFILDFVNNTDDILSSFKPYYELTEVSSVTDPNIIYDLKNKLDNFKIYYDSEILAFSKIFFKPLDKQFLEDHSLLYQAVNPAVDRFKQKSLDERIEIKSILKSFIRYYSFICQIIRLNDIELHEFHAFSRFLLKKLPEVEDVSKVKLEDVELEYYRIQQTSDIEQLNLSEVNNTKLSAINLMSKIKTEDEKIPLSKIIDEINQRFGTKFSVEDDKMTNVVTDCELDEKLHVQAKNNSIENFKYPFDETIIDIIINRFSKSNGFLNKYLDDENFQKQINSMLLPIIYDKLREK